MDEAKGIFESILNNKEWVFSGIGVPLVGYLINKLIKKDLSIPQRSQQVVITNVNSLDYSDGAVNKNENTQKNKQNISYALEKSEVRILFIDDDTKFQVVKILKNSGFLFVNIVKDVLSLDSPEVIEAHILFIDIQGVGKHLQFNDEGLGLALAIKKRFPQKKIVIYSAETKGERFHDALRNADSFLAKNAEPYEFIQIIEELMRGVQ
ncbi:MAG: response regulator transcription factor [Magnetococcales bacterium]|nr:response regulator transcription factor [Magnetococcales bacterium]